MTPNEMQVRLTKALKDADKVAMNGVRRGLRAARTAALPRIASRGIGRAVFGKDRSGARKNIKTIRARKVGNVIHTGLTVNGIPGLLERGGSTKPHPVNHPGGPVAGYAHVEQAVRAAFTVVTRDVERDLQAHWSRLG